MIKYEFPLNERTRSLLRLEDLYERFDHFVSQTGAFEHHFALQTLFEIIETGARADLKSDLLQELERQRLTLESLRNNPQISEEALDTVLQEIERTSSRLLEVTGKFGQHIRENEWLMTIKQRMSIPGGVCEFDIPSYHYWLKNETESRRQDLATWIRPLLPIRDGSAIVLRLLRDSGKSHQFVARSGMFQQMSGGKIVQLLKVDLSSDIAAVPELSANKYAINVRFTTPGGEGRPKTVDSDIPFTLTYCNL
ncbi:cell division protein ZapD [Leeia sp. TBRC 13508]|uniref:Cell division protein ZapD n=1 Tax=Leeia speluncae TaxID=2884804 RepID=A0ABS8D630_9NEIS|nr:cell division protein ZapD [Leeia speluncae]MCB6183637.1 cell division protein ZapD [Leeia speluncae]